MCAHSREIKKENEKNNNSQFQRHDQYQLVLNLVTDFC